jgi:organic hydroperoxide reductase OsmC/OhrA
VGYPAERTVGDGKLAITRVVLRPRIEFGATARPSTEEIARLHALAHEHCFIANSVLTAITVEKK